jgi:hypothetical protein
MIRVNRASGNVGRHVASHLPGATVEDLERRADSVTARIAAGSDV